MFELCIRPARVGRALLALFVLLLLVHVAVVVLRLEFGRDYIYGLALRFDFDRPISVPDWFTGVLFLGAALSSLMCGVAARAFEQKTRPYWFGLAGLLAFASVDEVASIHIRLATGLGREDFAGWTLFYAPAVGVVVLLMLPLLVRLPRPTAIGMVASGAAVAFGAIGLERVGAAIAEATVATPIVEMTKEQWVQVKSTWLYVAFSSLEESLEMCGLMLYIVTVLDYLSRRNVKLRVSLG